MSASGKEQADDRRIAEAQYKLALALHFADAPEDALVHARAAVDVCAARIARLSAPAPEGAAAAAAGPEPAAAGAAAAEEEDAKLAVRPPRPPPAALLCLADAGHAECGGETALG